MAFTGVWQRALTRQQTESCEGNSMIKEDSMKKTNAECEIIEKTHNTIGAD